MLPILKNYCCGFTWRRSNNLYYITCHSCLRILPNSVTSLVISDWKKRNPQSWPITYDLFYLSYVRTVSFWLVPSNLPYMLIVQLHTQIHKSIVPVAPFCIYSSLTMTARLTREMLVLSPRTRFRSTAHRHSSEICICNVSSPRDLDLIMLRRQSPLCGRVVFDWILLSN